MALATVNSVKFARNLILSELKKRQKSNQETISENEKIVAIGFPMYDGDDQREASYELEHGQRLHVLIGEMIQALGEGKRECDGEGRFLDCTCPSEKIYTREETCKTCIPREFERLTHPNFYYAHPLGPVTRSQVIGPATCFCDRCTARTGWRYWMYLGDAIPDSDNCDCYKTKSLDGMCTTCLLSFAADQLCANKL
jgi:hypothetical protein